MPDASVPHSKPPHHPRLLRAIQLHHHHLPHRRRDAGERGDVHLVRHPHRIVGAGFHAAQLLARGGGGGFAHAGLIEEAVERGPGGGFAEGEARGIQAAAPE